MSYKWEITIFVYLSYIGLVFALRIDHDTIFIIWYDFCGCLGYLVNYNQIKQKGDNAQFSLKIQINSMTNCVY